MLQRGAVLSGKYRIDGVLGEGGMAVVYAVTHLRNTARLAVKVLHASSQLKGHIRARFVREGKVANSVNHPGAVQMIDDGVAEDGSPYLVMEHLNGLCVDDIAPRAIPLSAALNVAYQVLDVLQAAHENGIVHRDIKPANLFVLRNGRVKVLDFGISRLHDGAEPFDSQVTGSVMGTPFFMAPEQARANASAIDARTDLFAVGATLFSLISGKYLHTGDDSEQVMVQAATQQARSLDSVAPGTPRAVVDLVAKAVAYDSAARWGSAQAMQEAVRQVHETLYGPIEFEPLAKLVLTLEFRRKSHARLTRPMSPLLWASSHADVSALSTTLPAVAGVTRSAESLRPVPDSESPSSRLSPEPPELAGWTGQVKPKPKTTTAPTQFAGTLSKARVVRIGVLAFAISTIVFGFAQYQTQARAVAAKPPLNADAPPPAPGRTVEASVATTQTSILEAPPQAAQRPSAQPDSKRRSSAKSWPPSKNTNAPAPSSPTPSPPPTSEPSVHTREDRPPLLVGLFKSQAH